MNAWFDAVQVWFDGRSKHERVLLPAALMAAALSLFETLWWQPVREQVAVDSAHLSSLRQEVASLEAELEFLDRREALDPDAALREQLDKIAATLGDLDDSLRSQALQLLAPTQTRLVLRDLLDNVEGLRLVSMRTDAPQRLVNATDGELPALYRHGLVVDLEGEYFALLEYLKALEQLPWRLYWLGVEVRADELSDELGAAIPRDRVTQESESANASGTGDYRVSEGRDAARSFRLRLYTVSLSEEWISV